MVQQQPYHPFPIPDYYYFHSPNPWRPQAAALDYSPAQPCLQNIPSAMLSTQLLGCCDIAAISGMRNGAKGVPKIPLLRLQAQEPHQSLVLVWCLLGMVVLEGGGLSACHAWNMWVIGTAPSHTTSCVSIKMGIWRAASPGKQRGGASLFIKMGRWSSYEVKRSGLTKSSIASEKRNALS